MKIVKSGKYKSDQNKSKESNREVSSFSDVHLRWSSLRKMSETQKTNPETTHGIPYALSLT